MLKEHKTEAELIPEVADALRGLLFQIPSISILKVSQQPVVIGRRPDILLEVSASGESYTLIVELKTNAQPRFAREAIFQLRDYAKHIHRQAVLVLAAPYLSPEVRALCKEHGVGYVDLEGNAQIHFGTVFIQRTVPTRPVADKRQLKSIFSPKSAQILRALLRNPIRSWKVKDLAEVAGVSFGQVSNVRNALLEREWAIETPNGVTLTQPDRLLDVWRGVYIPPRGQRVSFYTYKHGKELETATFGFSLNEKVQHVVRAAFSAASWLAPYARVPAHYFYVDLHGYEILKERLDLSRVERGENVIVTLLTDQGPLRDTVEAAPGITCTSAVQTYLDLSRLGERGEEAAGHLREARLKWM